VQRCDSRAQPLLSVTSIGASNEHVLCDRELEGKRSVRRRLQRSGPITRTCAGAGYDNNAGAVTYRINVVAVVTNPSREAPVLPGLSQIIAPRG
jgi:hypothetical protein